jgi:hypothetical protein
MSHFHLHITRIVYQNNGKPGLYYDMSNAHISVTFCDLLKHFQHFRVYDDSHTLEQMYLAAPTHEKIPPFLVWERTRESEYSFTKEVFTKVVLGMRHEKPTKSELAGFYSVHLVYGIKPV